MTQHLWTPRIRGLTGKADSLITECVDITIPLERQINAARYYLRYISLTPPDLFPLGLNKCFFVP